MLQPKNSVHQSTEHGNGIRRVEISSQSSGGRCKSLCDDFRRKVNGALHVGALVGIAVTATAGQGCTFDFDQFVACGDNSKDPRCQQPTGSSSSIMTGSGGSMVSSGSESSTAGVGGMPNTTSATTGSMSSGGMGGAGGMESTTNSSSSSSSTSSSSSSSTGTGGMGPLADLSDTAGDNDCIHWLTSKLGTTQNLASDNHTCEPKPLADIPLAANDDLYVWSKNPATNDRVAFMLQGLTPSQILTKCSTYTTPPNQAEMEGELFSSGFAPAVNTGVLPSVVIANAGCPNGAAFLVHLQ